MNRVLAFTGGGGGAKLALGLQHELASGALTVVVNTGDDFQHLGMSISPDLDTVLYTLCGIVNPQTGWGRADESWNFMSALAGIGGETWFKLGDKDLAIHAERTHRLQAGESLEAITQRYAERLGIPTQVLPMSNDQVRTWITSRDRRLSFQDYFVRNRCEPTVTGIAYEGAAGADAVSCADTVAAQFQAVIIGPSNPWLSIEPIFAIPRWRAAVMSTPEPVIAVSPLIGAGAVKGPTAKIMRELGLEVSPLTIERQYRGLIDGLVLDPADACYASHLSIPVHIAPTLIRDLNDQRCLAREVLGFADTLRSSKRSAENIARRGSLR